MEKSHVFGVGLQLLHNICCVLGATGKVFYQFTHLLHVRVGNVNTKEMMIILPILSSTLIATILGNTAPGADKVGFFVVTYHTGDASISLHDFFIHKKSDSRVSHILLFFKKRVNGCQHPFIL